MSAAQYPAIIRSALASSARREHLEEAVMASLHHAIRSSERGGDDAARAAIGEEGWAWLLTHYQGLGPVIAARVDLMGCGIVPGLAAHLAHVWDNPPAALMGTTASPGDSDIIGGREVALLFIETWAKNGLEPPIAEVRGLWIRRGDARQILTSVMQDARENGFLDANETSADAIRGQRERLQRIVLNRLQHAQVQRGREKWVSPLAAYYGRQNDDVVRRASDIDIGSPYWTSGGQKRK